MTKLVLGDHPANMLDAEYLGFGQYFPSDEVTPVEVGAMRIVLRDPVFETQGDALAFAASLPENTVHLVGLAGSVQVLDPSWFPLG